MKIGIDADGTGYDLITPWLGLWNEISGQNTKPEDITEYNPHIPLKLNEEDSAKFYNLLQTPGLFLNLKPMEGFIDNVNKLHEAGNEIYMVSSPAGPLSAMEKMIAFKRDFPWMKRGQIILMHDKHFLNHLDVMIDDAPEHAENFAEHPTTDMFGIEQPWNRKYCRRWLELAKNWEELIHFMKYYYSKGIKWT